MNYKRIYDLLIERANSRQKLGVTLSYSERHHIIPKCLGGSNSKDNIVILTAAEHFLAHQLLVKIYPDNDKLCFAAHAMTIGFEKRHDRSANKHFEWLKIRNALHMRKMHAGRIFSDQAKKKMSAAKLGKVNGENNGFYGKTHSEDLKKKISERQKIRQIGESNTNAKYWQIRFADGTIKTIKSLKTFCQSLNVSVYALRNNKISGYEFIGEIN